MLGLDTLIHEFSSSRNVLDAFNGNNSHFALYCVGEANAELLARRIKIEFHFLSDRKKTSRTQNTCETRSKGGVC